MAKLQNKLEESEKIDDSVNDLIYALLKKNKDEHVNFVQDAESYRISSGSLQYDHALGGGFGAGFHRFGGTSESGKTSEAFVIMENFFKKFTTARGIYVKTERLSAPLQKRINVKFVKDPSEWKDGTCLMLETNIYELTAQTIEATILGDTTRKYCIIVDSLDGLQMRGDLGKDYGEAVKVGGPAVITKLLMKRLSIYIEKYGHIVMLVSQKTAEISISAYAPSDPRMINGSGGNAAVHFSNTISEFGHRYKGDDILKNEKEKPDIFTNPIIGHWVKITLKKTEGENSHYTIKYPVKHGRIGNAIWLERELMEFMVPWGFLEKGGAWFEFSKELVDTLGASGVKFEETRFQGENKVLTFLEKNPQVTDAIRSHALKTLSDALS